MGYTGESAIGYTIEDTIEFAKLAEDVVDIIQLREKICASPTPPATPSRRVSTLRGLLHRPEGGRCHPDRAYRRPPGSGVRSTS